MNNIAKICKTFDIEFEKCQIHNIPILPELSNFRILAIVGASGSGKTSMLKKYFNYTNRINVDEGEIICNMFETPEECIDKLGAVGLNSIPSWLKPYKFLSNGEQFRVNLALQLTSFAVIDEFTSVVDRNVAKAVSVSLRKYVDSKSLTGIVISSCHKDILEWLEPDLVFDLDDNSLSRRSLRRPEINLSIRELHRDEKTKVWEIFRKHHYLNTNLNKSARSFCAYWGDNLVGFSSALTMPSSVKNAYREHRTVVLPDFQGLGIGRKLSEFVAQIHINEGKRYFSKTSHYRLGLSREKSLKWRATSKNKKIRNDFLKQDKLYNNYKGDSKRLCFSHEYIG